MIRKVFLAALCILVVANANSISQSSNSVCKLAFADELAIQNSDKTCIVYSKDEALANSKWLLVAQRLGRKHDYFSRTYENYQMGFGSISSNFWIGLDKLYQLTRVPKKIRFEFTDYENKSIVYFIEYAKFQIADASDQYRLTVGSPLNWKTWNDYAKKESDLAYEFGISNGSVFVKRGNCDLDSGALWWFSSFTSCPSFCPICNMISSHYPGGDYCYWDESRIFIAD